MILLTDKETGDAIELDTEYKFPRSDGSETWTFDCRPIAKAQIKKVVEWLEEHLSCDSNGDLCGEPIRVLAEEDWRALQKEAEDD